MPQTQGISAEARLGAVDPSWTATGSWGRRRVSEKWGYPNSWMVFVGENLIQNR